VTRAARPNVILAVVAAGLAAATPRTLAAAELRGTLTGLDTLQPTPASESQGRRLFYWEEPNGALDTRRPRAIAELDLTVVLTGAGVAESSQPVNVPVVGGRCRPGTAVVSANTVLRIQNNDWFPHEFFAAAAGQTTPVAGVQPEPTAPRSERQVQIAQAGVYELRDRLSPLFRCFILVGAGQGRVANVAQDGAFRWQTVADGDYTVRVYFEGRQLTEVPGHLANARDLVLPPINLAAPAPGAPGASGASGAAGGAPGAGAAGATPPPTRGRRRRGH